MRYIKAPILEAVLEFRWAEDVHLDALKSALELPVLSDFETRKPRRLVKAALDVEEGQFSHESRQIGFDLTHRDGSERVFLELGKFVYIRPAPYSKWDDFSKRALELLEPTIRELGIKEFSRVGVRFVNRIDAPHRNVGGINTDDYITIKFDGPREDAGIIDEFQMRLVKPTRKDGIAYALVVGTVRSPLPGHVGIVLDIDVFTRKPVPSSGLELLDVLAEMRLEKNDIFESCITEASRDLFGGTEA